MRQTFTAATALLALALVSAPLQPAAAQSSPFAPRLLVDDKVITYYEFDQRMRFMRLLNAPGDPAQEAEKSLIEDRLRLIAADRMKLRIPAKQIDEGMAEFAARFELPVEQFVAILEANGVARETFRDFVHAGMAWREVVGAKFGPSAMASIYESDVDLALSTLALRGTTRVLLSEIILPADKRVKAQELSAGLKSEAAFAAAARSQSLGETAQDGGRTDWRDVGTMPQQVLGALNGLQPGQVSPPVRLSDGRYGIYLLRNIEQKDSVTPAATGVDYAILRLPGAGTPATEATLASLQARVMTCTDLNAFGGELTRQTVAKSALPRDVAGRLAGLDENEMSFYKQGNIQVVLMHCSSRVKSAGEPDRNTVRTRLAERRIGGQADLYLQELRSNAHIRRP